MKLMVAIPTVDYIHFEFTKSLVELVRKLERDGIDFQVCFFGSSLVYDGRNYLADSAVTGNYTHVLWLDADMVFNADIFDRLYAHGKDIVTGVYHARRPPHRSCIFTNLHPVRRVKEYPEELFEVVACGFGCVLTSVEVLRLLIRRDGSCFQPTAEFGEDITFCIKAAQFGFKVYCDPTIKAGHIGHITFYPDDCVKKVSG